MVLYKSKLILAGLFLVYNSEVIESERNPWPDEVKHLDFEAEPLKFLPTQVCHRLPLNAPINNFKKSMIDCTQKKPSFKQCNTTVNQYIKHVVVSLHLISQDHSDRFIYEVLTKFLSPPSRNDVDTLSLYHLQFLYYLELFPHDYKLLEIYTPGYGDSPRSRARFIRRVALLLLAECYAK